MAIQPWKLLSENLVYNGYRKIVKRFYELPSGRKTNFDIQLEGPSVTVVAITPEQKIILINQFRPGPGTVALEFPGGGIDNGHEPLQAAKNELIEETGYTGEFQLIGKTFKDSWSTQVRYHFVATNAHKIQEPTPGPNEFLEMEFVTPKELRQLLKESKITGAESAYMGLDYLNLL